jgi:prepilin-type N-terminal cleavage/methylation domain-containing protein
MIKRQSGFTLIELMLAMTFISFLLLAVALTTIQLSNIYNKGTTLQAVNQAGRAVSSSLQRDIAASEPFTVSDQAHYSGYTTGSKGGRLCLGQISYLWNYGTTLNNPASGPGDLLTYAGTNIPVRLARVIDPDGSYCKDLSKIQVSSASATELLGDSATDLAIQPPFTLSQPPNLASGAVQPLYSLSFVIGTNEQGTIDTSNATCVPPADDKNNWQFCAVNVFSFTTRAGIRG